MTDIVVDTPTVEVTNSTYIEVDSGPVSTEITKPSDIEVIGSKQEYSIVGDALYAKVSADSAPDWLTSIIDSTVAIGLNSGLQDLQSANASLVAAVGEMEVAKNEYQQLINIDSTVDASVVSHLGTLNSTVAQNSASIVTLEVNKVTASEATAIALSQISAELGTTGGIGAEVTRIDSAVAALDQAYSTSIDTLTATYQSTNADLAATSTLVSTVQADVEGVRAQFAYNVNAQIGGQYYTSGFGLDTSGTYGGTGTELDPFISEFWINAEKLKFTNTNNTGQVSPFTIDASGPTPQISFNGNVDFSSLGVEGTTTINGGNITTGSINLNSLSQFVIPVNYTGTIADSDGLSVYNNGILRIRLGSLL